MALFNNTSFRLMEQGLDAVWLKQRVISQNIANNDTPDYKARTVHFKAVLKDKISGGSIKGKELNLETEISVETGTNQIFDGNNVDMEKEQISLADAQIQYDTLSTKMINEFNMIKTAIAR